MKDLNSKENLEQLIRDSYSAPQLLFKHSTRCAVSAMALGRMKPFRDRPNFHLLDVIGQRELSGHIANTFGIIHQSPQLLIIHNGECAHESSHLGISVHVVEHQLSLINN